MLWMIAQHYPGRSNSGLKGPGFVLLLLFLGQVILGLCVIWSKENPAIATGHQALGAALLGVSVWLLTRMYGAPSPMWAMSLEGQGLDAEARNPDHVSSPVPAKPPHGANA